MSFCASPTVAAKRAVDAPIKVMKAEALGASSKIG
jgi:hypothetical protein